MGVAFPPHLQKSNFSITCGVILMKFETEYFRTFANYIYDSNFEMGHPFCPPSFKKVKIPIRSVMLIKFMFTNNN